MADNQTPDWLREYEQPTEAPTTPKQRKVVTEAAVGEATAPYDIRAKAAGALSAEAKAELDALRLQREQQAGPEGERAAARAATKRAADVENLLGNINQARQNISGWSTGVRGQLTQGLWGSSSADLREALESISSPIVLDALAAAKSQSKTGASGFGALSERELSLLRSSIASLSQSQSREQLLRNLNRIETHFRRFQAYNAGMDPDQPEGAFYAGLAPAAKAERGTGPSEGGKAVPGSYEPSAERAGMNATISAMIRAGRTAEQIRAWADSIEPGLGGRLEGIESNIAAVKQNPEYAPKVDVERKFTPAEGMGAAAVEGMMTAPGAAATGFTDVYTSGLMDEATGGPRSAAMMQYAQEQNPNAYALGQVGGGIAQFMTGAAGLNALRAKYAVPEVAPWLADVLQGAAYGAGSAEGGTGDRAVGALTGGVTSAAGGMGTRALGNITSGALTGARSTGARLASKYGIPMTIGQVMGGGLKETEERVMGWPYIGGQIGRRRSEALEGFNRAAFNEAVAPLGGKVDAIGSEGVQAAQDLVEQAYTRALDGLTLQVDQPMVQTLRGKPYADLRKIPRVGDELAQQVDSIVDDFVDASTGVPVLSGENLQAAWRSLRSLRQSYKNDPQFGRRIAPALTEMENAFTDAMQRQAPERAGLFSSANEAYKRTNIIGDTVDFAGDVFTPSQLNVRSRQTGRTFGGKAASQRGDRPFYDLIRAGRSTLPSQVKDPGTAGQLALPLAAATVLGGGQYATQDTGPEGEPRARDLATPLTTAALGALVGGVPYSRAGQKALTNIALAPRPQLAQDLGSLLQRYTPAASRGIAPAITSQYVERVPQPNVEYQPEAFAPAPNGLSAVPQPTQGGYYDPETDTFVLSNGMRLRPDGSVVEE